MSVISKNPFDLLNEDGDAPAPAPAPAKAAAPAPKQQRDIPGSKPPQNKNNDENKPSSGSGNRGRGGYYNRGAPRNVIRSDKDKPIPDSEITIVEPEQGFEGERRAPGKNERGQGRPRGHGEGSGRGRATRTRGRGSYGGAGGPALTGGERRHDGRRSAHALPDSEKKIASGWGADEGQAELTAEVEGAVDAVKEAAQPQTPAAAEDDGAGWGADVPADAAAPAEFAPTPAADSEEKKPVEEEDNTKSYDEYLAERAKAALGTGLGKLEGRQVEGTSEFTGSAFKRQEEDFFGGAKKGSAADKAKKEKEKKEKVFIEVEGRFAPPSRGEGRGGRGGPRGGFRGGDRPPRGGAGGRGGRGGNRNASGAAAINGPAVSDESAFPALGA